MKYILIILFNEYLDTKSFNYNFSITLSTIDFASKIYTYSYKQKLLIDIYRKVDD